MTNLITNTIIILALLALLTHGKHESVERAISDIVPNEETLPVGAPDNVQGTIKLRTSHSFECDSSDSSSSSSSSSSSDSTDSSDDSTNSIDATYIFGDITGLSPGAIYDLHIHTNGDIYNESVVDCNLAGITSNDHFNPDSPLDKHTFGPHMGDLPRIIADEDGNAKFQVVAPEIKLNGVNSVIGRAFIIDLVGPHLQVACGIIEAITDSPDESESSESSDSSADDNAKQRSNAMLKALGNNAFYGETGLLTVEAFITGAIWILVAMFMFCTVFCYCVITRRAKNDTQYMIETIQDSA
eukprot:919806_1